MVEPTLKMEQPPWWAYCIISLVGFIGLIILNLIVNRINAARIEERYTQVMAKAGRNAPDTTQPQCPKGMEEPAKCACDQSKTKECPRGNQESTEPTEISVIGRVCMHVEPDDDEKTDPKADMSDK